MAGQNYVSELNSYKQKNNVTVIYEEVSVNGTDHDRTFTFKVIVNGVEYPEAIGKTKKDARHCAAREALEMIRGQSNTSSDTTPNKSQKDSNSGLDSSLDYSSSSATPVFENQTNGTPSTPQQAQYESSSRQSSIKRFLLEFEEITSLGKGGFGSVYKARNKLDKNMYAVKCVKYEKKAEREVAVLARLEHDNIVRYSTSWFEELPGKLLETSESYSSSRKTRTNMKMKWTFIP
ncbi:Interferon-induced, double-stranded RNA-activated protein kinase [Acipenser ruthenus]|uniref:Interferon-induced, double-stranded RNA-activated protein kinase n=1 Tax=Acipenser ruthenus TaxID=7906 RepID=A0A444UAU8_ACIRT|nr:Interferon-induced, double-stranded RNA-activated protein kinase [Acipenser ruthenus]